MNSFFRIFLLVLAINLIGISCSRKKNSFTRRAYHSTTSHYNYFFNARELMKKHLENLELKYVDDYNYLLPIFYYGTEEDATAAYADMDEIVKKCSRLIDRHSMYIKNDEFNRWIDDSYMLVGQAKFYKREYYGAIEVFEYITYAFSDKPSYYEAKIWLARTYLQMEDLREAEDILETIKEVNLPPEHKGEYFALYADLSIKKNEKEQAAIHLMSAIEFTKPIKLRRRYTYILAQLFHEKKDYANATKYYGQVLKMRPDYRMSFNAKLNQARSYDVAAANSDEIKKRLNKMLRDKKYVEFRDQIYFALAEMSFREGDEALGMDYLKKCTAASMGNDKVKSEAYKMLGDIFYDKPQYIISHAYYDSCLIIMPESHEKFDETKERKESLDDLVVNLLTINKQDSIQKIASLDEKSREKIINKIIKQIERDEEKKEQQLAQSFAQSYELANKRDENVGNGGKWYFYNQSVKSFGVSEFKKYWGTRSYEENWRRSNKNTQISFTQEVIDTAVVDSALAGLTNKDVEFYLAQLPLTDSAMAVSHNKIIYALYSAGNIFREQFQDYESAIECFNRLVADYDTCRYVESSCYQLYRIYLIIQESEKAEEYRNLILTKYPFSEYARIIKNPDYLKNKRDRNEQVEAYYGAAYKLYGYNLYSDVIEACIKSDSLFGDNHMKAKFDYLKVLSIGKSKSKEEFRMALEELIAKHPGEDVAISAQQILDKLNEISVKKEKREALYKINYRDEHIFVVITPNFSPKVDAVKIAISNYNINSVGAGKLNVSAVGFDKNSQMISVKSFKNKDEGMQYSSDILNYPDFISNVVQNGYEYFLISTENYAFFYQQKNLEEYLTFYNEHYKNNGE